MPSAAVVLLAVSAVIAAGYAAGRFAQATRFPDVAVLLIVGLAVGPANRALQAYGHGSGALAAALDPDRLADVAPLVSGFALVVILFEAGLGMEVRQVRSSLGPALRIAFPVLLLTSAAVGAIGYWVFGMPAIVAAILGVALSNVGQTVSSALLRRLRVDERTRAIGLVEMAVYDIVSVPLLVALFHVAGGTAGGQLWGEVLRGFAQTASISLVFGAGMGFVWILMLGRLHGHPHSYMLTLAALLVAYAATEELGGTGAVSVLLFGLLVGNRISVMRRLGLRRAEKGPGGEETKVQAFHEEISFFVRTVFFLFLGLSFTIGLRDRWPVAARLPALDPLSHQAALFAIGAALVLAALPLARAAAVAAVAGRRNKDWHGLIPIFGHGLGTAVLATLPFVWHDYRPGTPFHDLFSPWQPVFVNLAFLVILGSVLASGALVFVSERFGQRRPAAGAAPAAAGTGAGPAGGPAAAAASDPLPGVTEPLPPPPRASAPGAALSEAKAGAGTAPRAARRRDGGAKRKDQPFSARRRVRP